MVFKQQVIGSGPIIIACLIIPVVGFEAVRLDFMEIHTISVSHLISKVK